MYKSWISGIVHFVLVLSIVAFFAGCGDGGSDSDSDDGTGNPEAVLAITSFTPSSGPVGTQVTITGAEFSATPGDNVVRFNGTAAEVISSTETQIVATVPEGATSGAITVTVCESTATSDTGFTVTDDAGILLGGTVQGEALSLTPTVTVFAGTLGTRGCLDGIGTSAQFNDPNGITTDGTNLYVTDSNSKTISKIDISSRQVSTIAGTVNVGTAVDGYGTNAQFEWPSGITTDGSCLYITDSTRVRKMDLETGYVSTIATGLGLVYGITMDGENLYVASRTLGIIKIALSDNTATTFMTNAQLGTGFVHGIVTDGAYLYVTEDDGTYPVKKIAIATKEITTMVELGAGWFPAGLTTDGTYLYVADEYGTVRMIEIATNAVTRLAVAISGGYVTSDGTSLFVTDRLRYVVIKIE